MSSKNVLTTCLLIFVAGTVLVLVVKSLRRAEANVLRPSAGQTLTQPSNAPPELPTDGVIVYYFHGKVRCSTCQTIEAYAHQAVQEGFAEALRTGRLRWQVINYELPGNEHFVQQYELAAPTVVLVQMRGGRPQQWKNLMEVWELVGQKPAFFALIQQNVQEWLAGT